MVRSTKKTDNPPTIVTDADTPTLPAMVEAANQVAIGDAIAAQHYETTLLIGQRMGRRMMIHAIGKMLNVTDLIDLQKIKESKSYKGFVHIGVDGKTVTITTWADYCRLVEVRSVESVDLDLANFKQLGGEFFEAMHTIGIGPGTMRDIRQLPDDARQALMAEAESGDKETLLDLAVTLISRHAKEKEATETSLTKQVSDIKADYEAQEKVIQDKNKKIDAQEKLLHKLQNRTGDWHPRAFEICMENTRIGAVVLEAMDKLDVMRDAILNEDFGEEDREAAIEAMAVVHYDSLNQIVDRVAEVMAACDEVFIGYKEKARPILQVFDAKQG